MCYYILPLISVIYFVKTYAKEAHLRGISSQKSNMELFKRVANGFKQFLIFTKGYTLDIWLSLEYTSLSIEKQMFYRTERYGKKISCFNI